MSTIFSPSACSWKPSNPQGKCSSHSKKQKGTIEESELVTSSGDRSQRRSISPPQPELFGGTHPSVHFCIFQRGVSCLPLFRKFFYAIFTRSSPRSGVPADWFAWPPFFFFFFFFPVKMEVFHLPGCGAFFWEVWSLAGNVIGSDPSNLRS